MIESALFFLAKILFLFMFSGLILLTAGVVVAVAACAIGGCTCEVCRAISARFARSRG